MTAPLPVDATTHTVKVRLLSPAGDVLKTFDVPLERFNVYRAGCLAECAVKALTDRVFVWKCASAIEVDLPRAVAPSDADRFMELIGLSPSAGAEPTLVEVVRMWPAIDAVGACHAVDRCYASLAKDAALDRAESILAVYLSDVLFAQTSIRHLLGRANVIAPLMPMGASSGSAGASPQSVNDYMTLRDRLIDLAMSIEAEATKAEANADDKLDLHGTMVALVREDRTRVRDAVAEALRDWSLPLHAIDQVLATDFSIARPLTDAGARWLMTGDAASVTPFDETIRDVCPAFADALLGKAGILAAGGVVMAGGAVVNAIQRPENRKWLPGSDIDLWVVGVDHAARVKAFERTIRALFDAVPGCYATVKGSVVTIHAPTLVVNAAKPSAPVQVVFTPYHSASQVVCGFDLSHACAYYDGTDVYATWSCVCTSVTRVARLLPGMPAKDVRVAKAQAKGFAYVGVPPTPSRADTDDGDAAKSAASSAAPTHTGSCPATDAGLLAVRARETPAAPLYSLPDDVITAFCFRPLTSSDYAAIDDDDETDPRPTSRNTMYGSVPLSKRFAVAVPLMEMAYSAPKSPHSGKCAESVGMRLLDAKDAGPGISCHRADAMRDYCEARKNIAAAAAADLPCVLPSLSPYVRADTLFQIEDVAQKPGRFAESGFEFVTVLPDGPYRIVDGITGAPMRIDDLDASRHVFSGVMSLCVGVLSPKSGHVYCSRRMERLRVYPRAFVSMAARVMASAAIIAADHFADRAPAAQAQ
ncbi:hypothetical protein pdul_cds_20 [Pandoravirus dulcis]|uniref:Uncharacterized protein n=1 Tax=Pandoravirus dulcis TaxID=1349409 RepID=S4VUX3_9VIRU|nr:hypothetical protein pdul_cds_20 [Pandoravirus dulcis]AGO81891.1 hypothetical protein pdul_cds_20 [Pandoravirus dulcis]